MVIIVNNIGMEVLFIGDGFCEDSKKGIRLKKAEGVRRKKA